MPDAAQDERPQRERAQRHRRVHRPAAQAAEQQIVARVKAERHDERGQKAAPALAARDVDALPLAVAELGAPDVETHRGAEERVRRHGEERAQDADAEAVTRDAQDVLDGGEAERERDAVDDAVERLVELAADGGHTLPQLALAFPVTHRAVTSVIIGPRTLEQLESALAAASIALGDETLDRLDEIVAPGTNVYSEGTWVAPWISDSSLRRRRLEDRAASDGAAAE